MSSYKDECKAVPSIFLCVFSLFFVFVFFSVDIFRINKIENNT